MGQVILKTINMMLVLMWWPVYSAQDTTAMLILMGALTVSTLMLFFMWE